MTDTNAAVASAHRGLNAKIVLWAVLFVATVWVALSNDVLLMIDYQPFHGYRLKIILDRWLLIPHAFFGIAALLIGPFQFSSRLRQRRRQLHRLMGRCYVIAVYIAALTAIAIVWGHPAFPGNGTQAVVWVVVTTIAWILARNGHIKVHRMWIARSYAVTLTFVSLRVLSIWPAYWNLSDSATVYITIGTTLASVLVADVIMNWQEITQLGKVSS